MKTPESCSSLTISYQKNFRNLSVKLTGQNPLSFIGPALWNKVPIEIKRKTNLNAYKRNLKKY